MLFPKKGGNMLKRVGGYMLKSTEAIIWFI